MLITEGADKIKVEGHKGTWYVIDSSTIPAGMLRGTNVFLLEHEQYGEDAAHIIVNAAGDVLLDEVFNGFHDLWLSEGIV